MDQIMKTTFRKTLIAATLLALCGTASAQSTAEHPTTPPPAHERQAPAVERNLKTFDVLDFDVFSNQKWDRLQESHAKDIVVTWPDGHETKGIEKHIDDLKALFVFAPDITIKVHPIRFGSGTWTAATGVRHIQPPDAHSGRQDYRAQRKTLRHRHGHHRALERQDD